MIEEAIVSLVTANAAVKALIGTRLYPNLIPEKAQLPAAAYQLTSTGTNYNHSGQSSIATPELGFTFDSRSYDEAKAIGAAVKAVLSGYRGTVGTVKIGSVFLKDEFEAYNPASQIFMRSQIYTITWKEV
jgi:hypothetical protein